MNNGVEKKRLTDYVLGELSPEESRELERRMEASAELRKEVEEIRCVTRLLSERFENEPGLELTLDQRRTIRESARERKPSRLTVYRLLGSLAAACFLFVVYLNWPEGVTNPADVSIVPPPLGSPSGPPEDSEKAVTPSLSNVRPVGQAAENPAVEAGAARKRVGEPAAGEPSKPQQVAVNGPKEEEKAGTIKGEIVDQCGGSVPGVDLTLQKDGQDIRKTVTDASGRFELNDVRPGTYELEAALPGFATNRQEVKVAGEGEVDVQARLEVGQISEVVEVAATAPRLQTKAQNPGTHLKENQIHQLPLDGRNYLSLAAPAPGGLKGEEGGRGQVAAGKRSHRSGGLPFDQTLITTDGTDNSTRDMPHRPPSDFNTEAYDRITENDFIRASEHPLSTFSIDVDTASYANVRRFLNQREAPPKDAVRIEELINYFDYDYTPPVNDHPFAVHIETAAAPWDGQHLLVRFGLKGKEIDLEKRKPGNFVFLIDVSGSMQPSNKLPLLKRALKLMVDNLNEADRVALVVYAGASGLVLPSTSCAEKEVILQALDQLEAGGSTNGGAGIELSYRIAEESRVSDGVNRVILATDGDFNVGVTNQGALTRLIEDKARTGIFLTVLGFGMGNYKDSTLEKLADRGNGNYAYIDTLQEARKVLVEQIGGTLVTIAKDVKVQVEFNPAQVQAYRLIGYENRLLEDRDFNDDTKDAGEIGAGHSVTAFYEVVPHGVEIVLPPAVDPLKYQSRPNLEKSAGQGELLTLKLRYKKPDEDVSSLMEVPLKRSDGSFASASADFRFAAAVAGFGMLLRDSSYKGDLSFDFVLETAEGSLGSDPHGYRKEFLNLVKKARAITDLEELER